MSIYLTNGQVAWRISERVGQRLIDGIYIIPEEWAVSSRLGKKWFRGLFGELRLNGRKAVAKKKKELWPSSLFSN